MATAHLIKGKLATVSSKESKEKAKRLLPVNTPRRPSSRAKREQGQEKRSKALPFYYLTALFMKTIGIMAAEASPVLACWIQYFPASAILLGLSVISCLGIASYRLWEDERNQVNHLIECNEAKRHRGVRSISGALQPKTKTAGGAEKLLRSVNK